MAVLESKPGHLSMTIVDGWGEFDVKEITYVQ
jgi:hypothetical protein